MNGVIRPHALSAIGAVVLALLAVLPAARARVREQSPNLPPAASKDGDRDIVFSAETYRWTDHYYAGSTKPPAHHGAARERILTVNGPKHLYRVNPNGSGLIQLTNNLLANDRYPDWSPDGRQLLFVRSTPIRKWSVNNYWPPTSSDIYVADPACRHLRRLLHLPASGRFEGPPVVARWSPDGKYIAVTGGSPREPSYCALACDNLTLLEATTGRVLHHLENVGEWTWSPDGHALFISGNGAHPRIVDGRSGAETLLRLPGKALWHVSWLASDLLAGQSETETARSWILFDRNGHAVRHFVRVPVHAQGKRDTNPDTSVPDGDWSDDALWLLPKKPDTNFALADEYFSMAHGGWHNLYRADLKTHRIWPLHRGNLLAVSPDGKRCLVANDDWPGPWWNGGARCGSLEVVSTSLPPGQEPRKGREITSRLMAFAGGDWR